jgi:hypothetical protein
MNWLAAHVSISTAVLERQVKQQAISTQTALNLIT